MEFMGYLIFNRHQRQRTWLRQPDSCEHFCNVIGKRNHFSFVSVANFVVANF